MLFTKAIFKMEVRDFIRSYHKDDVTLEIGYDDEGQFAHIEVTWDTHGMSLPFHEAVYDSEGDEVDKELFVAALKAIVDEHNTKYSSG